MAAALGLKSSKNVGENPGKIGGEARVVVDIPDLVMWCDLILRMTTGLVGSI